MKNIKLRVRDTKIFLSEAVEKLMDAKTEFEKAYNDRVILNADQLKEINEILGEVNHYLTDLDTIHSRFSQIELKSFLNSAVSESELNQQVEN